MATNLVELRSTGRRELGPWAHRGTRRPGDSMRHRGRLSGTTARRAPSRYWSGCCTGTPPCRWGTGWSQYLKKFTTIEYNLQCLVTTARVQLFSAETYFLLPVIGWACSHLIPLTNHRLVVFEISWRRWEDGSINYTAHTCKIFQFFPKLTELQNLTGMRWKKIHCCLTRFRFPSKSLKVKLITD